MNEIDQPLVSVLMTVYNREKYIAEAIESVIASTYQNWELIIVDDQSKDQSVEIARSYEAKDTRIKVYINETNLGDYPNRNKAASFAKGKYLKYLDSDDIIYPFGLEVMVSSMEMHPNAAIGISNYRESGQSRLPYSYTPYEAYFEHFFKGGLLYAGPTGAIFRTSSFNSLHGFDSAYSVASDMDFNLKCAKGSPIVIFQRDLFWWRPHEGQEINTKQHKYEMLNNKLNTFHLIQSPNPLSAKENKIAFINLKTIQARRILRLILLLQFKTATQKYKALQITPLIILLSILPRVVRIQLF